MQDILIASMCFLGAVVAFALGVLMVKRRREARAWAEETAAIAECMHADEVVAEQLHWLKQIHERWPETIRVSLDSRQRLTEEVDALLHGEPLTWELLERLFLERPANVHLTLRSRQHKMQICDANRLGLRVAVQYEAPRERNNPRDGDAGVSGVAGRELAEMRERASAR